MSGPAPEHLEPAEPTRAQFPCCEAEVCKRAAEFGVIGRGREIVSDHDHLMVHGKHYHLHCAPPAVEAPGFHTAPEDWPAVDPDPDRDKVDWLIDRVSSIVQEAPQAEREPLLYRAHVLGVLHQAKATERIADYLESLDWTASTIAKAVETLCAELVKPEGPQGTGAPHEFMPHTGGGKDCYVCGMPQETHE